MPFKEVSRTPLIATFNATLLMLAFSIFGFHLMSDRLTTYDCPFWFHMTTCDRQALKNICTANTNTSHEETVSKPVDRPINEGQRSVGSKVSGGSDPDQWKAIPDCHHRISSRRETTFGVQFSPTFIRIVMKITESPPTIFGVRLVT